MKRNPHPARGSRVTALGVSVTAFVSIVTSLAWNTHQSEAAAIVPNPNAAPVGQTTLATGTTAPVAPGSGTPSSSGNSAPGTSVPGTPSTPAANIAPTAPAAPTKTNKAASPAAPKVAAAKPATPTAPTTTAPTTTAPTTAAPAPVAPAPTVVYTCMSPGGTTQNPTSSGNCRSGYTLTKI